MKGKPGFLRETSGLPKSIKKNKDRKLQRF